MNIVHFAFLGADISMFGLLIVAIDPRLIRKETD
jgi:hypothetical protein